MGQFSDRGMGGETEMGRIFTKQGLGYIFTCKRCWRWNCMVGEREGGPGEDIWMLIVREDRGYWIAGGGGGYDPPEEDENVSD